MQTRHMVSYFFASSYEWSVNKCGLCSTSVSLHLAPIATIVSIPFSLGSGGLKDVNEFEVGLGGLGLALS